MASYSDSADELFGPDHPPDEQDGPGLGSGTASGDDLGQEIKADGSSQDQAEEQKSARFVLASAPAEEQDQAQEQKPDQAEEQKPAKLQPQHLAELHALGVDGATIDRLKMATYYDERGAVGWSFLWTDGTDTVHACIPDRDKRTGPKVEWPKGQTLIVGSICYVKGSRRHVIVEGPRQALAMAAYAPPDVSVWVMNGSNGIHGKIVDRLRDIFAGDTVTLVTDADWRTNDQVGKAATEAVPEHLAKAGVVDVLVADLGTGGTDGVDDLVLATPEEERAGMLAKILDQAKPARDRRLELETTRQLVRLQAIEEARRQLRAQEAALLPAPALTSLRELLEEPDDDPAWLIDQLWPTGGNVVLAAQRKAGKTVMIGNLIRSLTDGDAFLGRARGKFALAGQHGYDVTPLDGMVALLDLELDRRMLRRWLRDQAIGKTDQVMAEALRGRAGLFDVRDDGRRQAWARVLSNAGVVVLFLDPLSALLDHLGLDVNSNADVGPVLAALDALKAEAGISALFIAHHMGHLGERSLGASRLRGWPDAEWFIVRERAKAGEEPPPDAARFFLAEGRDVMVPETRLDYDQATRRLTVRGGNRVQHQATKNAPAILEIVGRTPGASGRDIVQEAMDAKGISKHAAEMVLRRLITDGKIRTEKGPRNARLHYLEVDP